MNKANLLRVADAIEKHEIEGLGFNMISCLGKQVDRSVLGCETTACIAGWAAATATGQIPFDITIIPMARDFLGLHRDRDPDIGSTKSLFFGAPSKTYSLDDVSPAQAVNVLRYAAEHDVIDWDAAQTWAASKSGVAA